MSSAAVVIGALRVSNPHRNKFITLIAQMPIVLMQFVSQVLIYKDYNVSSLG